MDPSNLALAAAVLAGLVSAAGIAAWLGLYSGGQLLPFRQWLIAVVILLALIAQPVIAVLLAIGTRSKT